MRASDRHASTACRSPAAGGAGETRRTWPEQQRQPEGASAVRSRSGDKRRHTAYVISTTGGARPVSLVAKRRDGSKSVPFSRSELERLIDPHKGVQAESLRAGADGNVHMRSGMW